MEGPDSCSMTPPLSPLYRDRDRDILQLMLVDDDDLQIPDQPRDNADPLVTIPVTFCCHEADLPINTHHNGPLRQGTIDRLQQSVAQIPAHTPPCTVQLFDFTFDSHIALVSNRDTLFNLLRESLNKLEKESKSSGFVQAGASGDYLKVRHDIRAFFDHVQHFIHSSPLAGSVVPELLQDLLDLVVFVGRLQDLAPSVIGHAASKLGNKSPSAAHHLFHAHLEVHWGVLETLAVMELQYPDHLTNNRRLSAHRSEGELSMETDAVGETVHLLVWDLVVLAIHRYNKTSSSNYDSTGPFPCSCVKELTVMLIQLLQHRQQKYAKQSFWVAVTAILQSIKSLPEPGSEADMEIDSNVFALPCRVRCSDPCGFSLWFVQHVSPLYNYDSSGHYSTTQVSGSSNFYLLTELMKTSLKGTESSLRQHLRACLRITAQWEPNSRLIGLLWESFYKRLNDSFKLQTTGLMGHASLHKSASSLYENCRRIAENDLQGLERDNSFHLFLRLLAQYLTRSPQPVQAWKQLKGRFYSKFHVSRVQELQETGIQNLAAMFVVLAHCADTEEVTSKLLSLLSHTWTAAVVPPARRAAAWTAVFCVTLLYAHRRLPLGFLADSVAGQFDQLASGLAETKDGSRYNALWPLVALYVDSSQDVIEASTDLGLQEYRLIGSGLSVLLPKCREGDMRQLLNFLLAVLNKYRSVQTSISAQQASGTWCERPTAVSSLTALTDRLWTHGYGFVRQHSTTQTPPAVLADVAAGFWCLAKDVPAGAQSGNKEDALQSFTYFSLGADVNPVVSCRYLCQLLPDPEVSERLGSCLRHHDDTLIQAWFRCHWYMARDSDGLSQLTGLILKLPEMASLMSSCPQRSEDVVLDFLAALGERHRNTLDHASRMSLRERAERYFSDAGRHLATVLRGCGSSALTHAVYDLAGHMTKHCAGLIYVSTRPKCVLPILLERCILPRSLVVQNKDLPPVVMATIRDTLPLFVSGFSYLDYKGDAYLQRKLREIVTHYFTRFPVISNQASGAQNVHPFISALVDEASPLRQYVLSLLLAEYPPTRGGTAGVTLVTLVLALVRRTRDKTLLARDCGVLLGPMLSLLVEDSPYRQQLGQILTGLLEASRGREDVIHRCELSRLVLSPVTAALPLHHGRVFRALETVVTAHTALFSAVIPDLTTAVRGIERKRGGGVDRQLRLAYCTLLALLGPEGREEKTRLCSGDAVMDVQGTQ